MKRLAVLVMTTGILGLAMTGCGRSGDPQTVGVNGEVEQEDTLPPLVVDAETPLLLDDPPETESTRPAQPTTGADNSACFVCHANYREEALAVRHARADVGCVACHGQSFAHRNDENNTTPPDKMIPADAIDKACRMCHTSHDVSAAKVVMHWKRRGIDKNDAASIVCTDCHGEHRLKIRTVRWNKKTGKLIK